MTTENKTSLNKNLPLAGIRVLEFAHMVMGPTCGLLLADLGAEVIKVEPTPIGDNTRRLMGSGAGYWMTYNRNKKSLAIDLKNDKGMNLVKSLIKTADIIIENFRPGAMDKLGLGYEGVKQIKSDIIYGSMKGFLPGPYEHRTALDEVVQMMTGLAYMTGPEGRPLRAGASVNDVMGGMFCAYSIVAALYQRQITGEGQLVETGLFENSAFLVAQHMMQQAVTDKPVSPMPSRVSAWAIYDVFDVKDNEQVFIGVVTDSQWQNFCEAFGLTILGNNQDYALNNQRVQARDKILPIVRETLLQLNKDQVMQLCEKAGLPFSPIQRPEDLFDDVHLNQSGGMGEVVLETGKKTKVPLLPFKMNGQRFTVRNSVPAFGENTHEILTSLGVNAKDISELATSNIINNFSS